MVRLRFTLVLLAACVAPLSLQSQSAAPYATSSDPSASILRPGDVIRLRIWREPDLSGEFSVDENGVATFPKIGSLKVSQESPESLKEKLLEQYAIYLRNPSVEVTMLRRINVLGAVQKPGLYPVDATMRISDALAAAGGATAMGDQHKVELVRDGTRLSQGINTDARIAETPLRSGDQIFVPERSFIVRNSGLVATAVSVSASLVIALFIRK